MSIYIYTYIHMCIYICVCVYVCVYMGIYVYIYMCVCNIVLLPIHPIKESHKTSTAQGTKSKLAMHSFTSQASDSPTTLPALGISMVFLGWISSFMFAYSRHLLEIKEITKFGKKIGKRLMLGGSWWCFLSFWVSFGWWLDMFYYYWSLMMSEGFLPRKLGKRIENDKQ